MADRWHLLHNLGEALEKVLARHHANLRRAFVWEEEHQPIFPLKQDVLAQARAVSQTEQLQIARPEQRLAIFTRVQELSVLGWCGASIARMLGINKKTAVKRDVSGGTHLQLLLCPSRTL